MTRRAKLDDWSRPRRWKNFATSWPQRSLELKEIIKTEGAEPVYVAGGRAYRLGADGQVGAVFDIRRPNRTRGNWPTTSARLAGRAAPPGASNATPWERRSLMDRLPRSGPLLDPDPPSEIRWRNWPATTAMQIDAWNLSFQGRTAFKWFGFVSAGIVAVILLSFVLLGVNGFFGTLPPLLVDRCCLRGPY